MDNTIIVALISAFSGAGILEFIKFLIARKDNKKIDLLSCLDKQSEELSLVKAMALGTLYDRAKYVGESYIKKGYITTNEYADYKKYLYEPYHIAGADGTIDKIMVEIDELPIK